MLTIWSLLMAGLLCLSTPCFALRFSLGEQITTIYDGTDLRVTSTTGGIYEVSPKSGLLKLWTYQSGGLPDTAEIALPDATSGFVHVGMMEEGGMAIISNDGTVTLTAGITANVTTTNNNDTTLNIYDSGTGAIVENQLGGPRETHITYWYN